MKTNKNKKRLCPPASFFYEPILKSLQMLGGSASTAEIYNKVLKITNLATSVIDEMHSFTMTEVEYRLMWARTDLKNYGAIENSKRRIWTITPIGTQLLGSTPINTTALKREIVTRRNDNKNNCDLDEDSPVYKNWRERIAEILHNLNPYAFEKLAQRLLRECGFSEVEVTSKSGDGGIDGVGKLRINGIFSFNVAFQCKRYKGLVGAPQIRDFRGSLGTNIEKGVIITTSAFTRAAIDEASCEGKRLIDLMDGEELINKLAEYGVGLNEVKSYEVDEHFFNVLNENA